MYDGFSSFCPFVSFAGGVGAVGGGNSSQTIHVMVSKTQGCFLFLGTTANTGQRASCPPCPPLGGLCS